MNKYYCDDDDIFFYFNNQDPLKHDGEFTVVGVCDE